MAQQYLLPCECGKTTPVSVAQAGRIIACDCGREQSVPTLVGLKKLERVGGDLPAKAAAAEWNGLRGGLFVVGVVLALVGLVVGGYSAYLLRGIDVAAAEAYVQHVESHDVETIDQLSPDQAYDLWQMVKSEGPGTAGTGLNVQYREAHAIWLKATVVGFVIAAVGLVMAGGSLIGAKR